MSKIVPHLWFDTQAVEASELYLSLFENSRLVSHTVIKDTPSGDCDFLVIELAGQEFMLISAGPYFPHSPIISFQVACQDKAEVDRLYTKLTEGGQILMPLESYEFNDYYAWVSDQFGISWQLLLSPDQSGQKITPALMFTGEQAGHAKDAVEFYTSIFGSSSIDFVALYGDNPGPDKPDSATQIGFTLEGQRFTALDSAYDHGFTFSEAISLLIYADTQDEIDAYWYALSAVPEAEQCGWLKDKFGVSWQVSPRSMNEMMADSNEERLNAVTQCMLQMKKIDVEELKRVYNSF